MLLLQLKNINLSFGPQCLLDQANLTVHKGQKIGLLGRNGAGKSTLLKMLAGQLKPDSGECWLREGIKVAYLGQELPNADSRLVYDVIASGLSEHSELLQRFHILSQKDDADSLAQLNQLQHDIEINNAWGLQQRIDKVISQLGLPADASMQSLSGGWLRRVALGKALVCEPDILLLDEPTNHLDIPSIDWLEKFLQSFKGTLLFVTHDRRFLQTIADTIVELDRGQLRQWQGDYQGFLQLQAQELAAEASANALFDKKLAQEEVWIRKGIKARRTRNEGRVRALKAMREQRAQRREQVGKASFQLEQAEQSGKIVAQAKNISHGFADKQIIKNFSTTILQGDKVGLVGINGCGKSTLLKILLGELKPEQGEIKLGTKIELAYFDQLRAQLDPKQTVVDTLSEGREFISINGKDKHVISYLQEFLFTPDRARQPVKALSGGEQNRLILAKLFSKPANTLVLDEPTNDLDVETLELLEDILLSFTGTVLLVSHDRDFLDNVVTSSIVFEADGTISENVGGYSDWLQRGGRLISTQTTTLEKKKAPEQKIQQQQQYADSKKRQQELNKLPKLIEKLEARIAELGQQTLEPGFYQQSPDKIKSIMDEIEQAQIQLQQYYQRWEELEN